MADDSEEVIRQRVIIEGADGALQELTKLGDEGAVAIDKLKKAGNGDFAAGLQKLSPEFNKITDSVVAAELATRKIAPSAKKAATALGQIPASTSGLKDTAAGLNDTADAADKSGLSLRAFGAILRGLSRVTGLHELSQASRIIRGVGQASAIAGPAIAAGIIAGLGFIADSAVNASEKVQDLAFAIGQTPQIFQAVSQAASVVGGSIDKFSSAIAKQPALIKATAQSEAALATANENIRTAIDHGTDTIQRQGVNLQLLGRSYANFRDQISLGLDPVSGLNEQIGELNDQYKSGKISTDQYNKSSTKLFNQLSLARKQQQQQEDDFQRQIRDANKALADQEDAALKSERAAIAQKRTLQDNATALEKLGIGAQQFKNLDLAARFDLIGKALINMEPGLKRNQIALELFGDDARKFVSALDASGGSISKFSAEAAKMIPVFTAADNVVADQFTTAVTKAGASLTGLKDAFGITIAPAFINFFTSIAETITELTPIAKDFAGVLADFLKPILDGLAASFKIVVAAIQLLNAAFNGLASIINSVFGTDIKGAQIFLGVLLALAAAFAPITVVVLLVVAALGFLAEAIKKVNWTPITNGAKGIFQPIIAIFQQMWLGIQRIFATGLALINQGWSFLSDGFNTVVSFITTTASELWTSLQGIWSSGVEFLSGVWTSISDAFSAVIQIITDTATSIWDFISTGFNNAATSISNAFNIAVTFLQSLWEGFKGYLLSWVASVISFFQPLIDLIKKIGAFFGSGNADSAQGAATGGFAEGGKVRGAGSATSDSILAWLSNGEFVMRAKAVAKYGADFMHAINTGKLDLGSILGYALGGFVAPAMSPAGSISRFAEGGLAQAGQGLKPVAINFEGTKFDAFMTAQAIDSLGKHAVTQRARRAGKRPSYVGG